jgi:hypothetical protein
VIRVSRDKLLHGALDGGDIAEYGAADGLRAVQGVKRDGSAVTDSMGRIWLSLGDGISVVDPARLKKNMAAEAIPHIQRFTADNGAMGIKDFMHVPARHRRIAIEYAGLSLAVPERARFRYYLEGYDRTWSEPTPERRAAYTNLGPGQYRFRVRASNPDGVWSATEASLAFDVDPAYWQTWWFRTGIALSLGLLAFMLYRLRLRQLTARLNLRFEERLAERTRIAQDLHDTLLQGFLSASMQIHVAADRLPSDSAVKPSLKRTVHLMREVIDEGRNVVRGLRSSPGPARDLEAAFSVIPEEICPPQGSARMAAFRVIVKGSSVPLHPVVREEVYRIGREALLNAFRHSRAGQIVMQLDYSSSLRLVVQDDGCGIEPQTLTAGRDGHWGLAGMRERADRIGARLRFWSNANAGTEVELTVPGHLAFQDRPKAAWRRCAASFREGSR